MDGGERNTKQTVSDWIYWHLFVTNDLVAPKYAPIILTLTTHKPANNEELIQLKRYYQIIPIDMEMSIRIIYSMP